MSREDAALDTIVADWPCLSPDARARVVAFVRELVGEPSPTADPHRVHEDPPSVRQTLTDGGSSIVAATEPVEGSQRHGNAVTTGSPVGTRLPAGSDPETGGDDIEGPRDGNARDVERARGEDRGSAAARSGAEGGAP